MFIQEKDNTNIVKAMAQYLNIEFAVYQPGDIEAGKHLNFHASTYRWGKIHQYIEKHHGCFDKWIFADVRDTVFQLDPFPFVEGDKMIGFYEAARGPNLAACGWNAGWVRDCFGQDVLSEIGSKKISCSGTSFGTTKAVREYVKRMWESLKDNPCERNGVDQGAHNVLVHKTMKDSFDMRTNEDGPVIHLGWMDTLNRDKLGRVLTVKKTVPALVHQIDRSQRLMGQLNAMFPILSDEEIANEAR